MAWPFDKLRNKQRDEIVAIDLGGRHTKAVHLQMKGGRFQLAGFTIQDSPSSEKASSVEVLAEHLKAVSHALGDKSKTVTVAMSATDTVVRRAELPPMPFADMRQLLKFNSKNYLQQELPDHVFDCSIVVPRSNGAANSAPADAPKQGSAKQKVLVGAAKRQSVMDVEAAIKQAGLTAATIVPGLVGPINSFELAQGDSFCTKVVALVELGFRTSTICMLQGGELVMHRVINMGGDRLTTGLADAMSISYAEAEGIKVGMPGEVQAFLEPLVSGLGRELRAFIDFFEHQQDVPVSEVYLSGGSARGELIVQALQMELVAPCKVWNPASAMENAMPAAQCSEFEPISSQFAVAVGAGISAF